MHFLAKMFNNGLDLLAFCYLIAICSAINDPYYIKQVKLNPAEFQKNIQQELLMGLHFKVLVDHVVIQVYH